MRHTADLLTPPPDEPGQDAAGVAVAGLAEAGVDQAGAAAAGLSRPDPLRDVAAAPHQFDF